MKLFKYLFVELINVWNEGVYLWIKERRRKDAIKRADKLSNLNNGRWYYVMKNPLKPDHYIVRNKSQLDRLKRKVYKSNANFVDYRTEAVYIAKNKH